MMTDAAGTEDEPIEDEPVEDEEGTVSTVSVCRRSWGVFNLLYRLLGRRSVTRTWSRQKDPRLEFDFDALTLCGVGLGNAVQRLGGLGLGPADEEIGEGNRYLDYEDLGINIGASDRDGIFSFELWWWDPEMTLCKSFPGQCFFRGRQVPLAWDTRPEDVVEHFGRPDETGKKDPSWMSYVVHNGEFTFYFGDDGRLISVDCTPV